MSTFLLLAYVFFFLCSAVGIGALSLERLRFRSSDNLEFLTFAFGLGSAIHAAIFIGLGAVHLLYPSLIFLIYLLTAIITCGNCWRPSWRTALGQSLASMPSTFANVQTLLSLGFLLFLFVPLFPQLLLPTISWDATAYHLLLPVVYLARHNVDFVTWFPQTAFPMGWHALFGFGEVVGDGRVSNVITFLTIFIPSFYLWFSLRKRFGWVAVLLAFGFVVFRPLLFNETSITPSNDYPLLFYTLLSAIALLKHLEKPSWRTWMLLGALASYTSIIKLTGVFVMMPILGLGLLGWAVGELPLGKTKKATRVVVLKKYAWARLRILQQNFVKQIIPLFLLTGVLLLPPIYWYGKTWIQAGNPIYPFMNSYFKGFDYDPDAVDLLTGDIQLLNNYVKPIWRKYKSATDTPPETVRFSELLALSGGIGIGLVGLVRGKKEARVLSIVGLVAMVPAIWLVGPLERYCIFTMPLLILAGGNALETWWKSKKFVWMSIPVWVCIILVGFVSIEATFTARQTYFMAIPKRNWISYGDPSVYLAHLNLQDVYPVQAYANTHLDPSKHKILMVNDNRMYYLHIPNELANPTLHGFFVDRSIHDVNQLADRLHQAGITHIILSKNWGVPPNIQKDLYTQFFASKKVVELTTIRNVTLYELQP